MPRPDVRCVLDRVPRTTVDVTRMDEPLLFGLIHSPDVGTPDTVLGSPLGAERGTRGNE